jgi:NAD(P) transhydrogenase subunit alpha
VNVPSSVAFHASQTFSRNLQSLLQHLLDREGVPRIDLEDPITGPMTVTHAGEVRVH